MTTPMTGDRPMPDLLHNVFWHCLTGPQAAHAAGTAGARRYAAGFSPIVAFENPADPDVAALAPHCAPGERLYCADWSGPVPAGWRLEVETAMLCMVWGGTAPDDDPAPDALPLGAGKEQPGADLNAMWFLRNAKIFAKLAEVTQPGDRVLVLFGAGHNYWLRYFARATPGFQLAEPNDYLGNP